jgi:DNA end-binding protein Ku
MAATVWKGYLSFGLVTFPVRLYSAARTKGVHFHMLHKKDLSRVKEVWYCVAENRPINRAEIVMGYEAGKDEYVVIDDEELAAIAPPTASTIEVEHFVAGQDVDPIYFETSYYLAPEEKVNKAYALFAAALTESKRDAVAKMAMHNREHMVLIRPGEDGLILHTLFYADELNSANRGQPAPAKFTAKELDLAKSLVNQMSSPFKPEQFHDGYRENVERLMQEKQKGQKITRPSQPRKAPVTDLIEALRRSLKAANSEGPATLKPPPQDRDPLNAARPHRKLPGMALPVAGMTAAGSCTKDTANCAGSIQ